MESQPQNPEFRINPENPMISGGLFRPEPKLEACKVSTFCKKKLHEQAQIYSQLLKSFCCLERLGLDTSILKAPVTHPFLDVVLYGHHL